MASDWSAPANAAGSVPALMILVTPEPVAASATRTLIAIHNLRERRLATVTPHIVFAGVLAGGDLLRDPRRVTRHDTHAEPEQADAVRVVVCLAPVDLH